MDIYFYDIELKFNRQNIHSKFLTDNILLSIFSYNFCKSRNLQSFKTRNSSMDDRHFYTGQIYCKCAESTQTSVREAALRIAG